jgi:hypothetical protein
LAFQPLSYFQLISFCDLSADVLAQIHHINYSDDKLMNEALKMKTEAMKKLWEEVYLEKRSSCEEKSSN